jgi:hypothetical protein
VGDLITTGDADWAAWEDVRKLIQERRALVESERKRLVEMQHVITAEQATLLMGALTAAIGKHVNDRQTLAAITAEFERITAPDDAAPAERPGGKRAGP